MNTKKTAGTESDITPQINVYPLPIDAIDVNDVIDMLFGRYIPKGSVGAFVVHKINNNKRALTSVVGYLHFALSEGGVYLVHKDVNSEIGAIVKMYLGEPVLDGEYYKYTKQENTDSSSR